jgi:parallel beta-helix repeat protein
MSQNSIKLKILVIICFVLLWIGSASASTFVVNQTSPACTVGDFYCDTIQEAVDMAKWGDTIVVCPGTYEENIEVDKSLTIRSLNGSDSTTVLAEYPNDHVFEVTADYVNISGITVKGATGSLRSGLYLYYADYCAISNNNCSNNTYGIRLYRSNNNGIYNNNCSNNTDDGIHPFISNSNIVKNNTVNYNEQHYGIKLISSNNNVIEGNNASFNSQYGIFLSESCNNSIRGNIANYNEQYHGICLISSNNNLIEDNNASNNMQAGIVLSESINNTIRSNIANYNKQFHGITLLESSNNNIIEDNNVSYNMQTGISLLESIGNTIRGNIAILNEQHHGISLLQSSNNNIITDNTASSNLQYGIALRNSSNNIIRGNKANSSKKDSGIILKISNYNIIANNTASNNMETGIALFDSNNNAIKGNIASSNKLYDGIRLQSSNNNIILNNDISNNTQSGIRLGSSSNNTICGNTANSNRQYHGISCLESSSNNIIMNNAVSNNNGAGILFESDSSNNAIKGNTAKSNYHGIDLKSSSNILLNNEMSYNLNGLFLSLSNNNTIDGNIIYLNTKDGIYLSGQKNIILDNIINSNGFGIGLVSENNSILNNIISSNQGRGLDLLYAGKNKIINNFIDLNLGEGIYSINSSAITISGNTINSNYIRGIELDDDSNFYNIYHNNIINNDVEDDSSNSWYNESQKEGNYWSDYDGVDLDGDGIGDTKIPHPEEGYDSYPLMKIDGWLTMSVWPHYLDFGKVYQGSLVNQTFTTTNYGNSILNVSSIKSDPEIAITGIEFPAEILKGHSQNFTITLNTGKLEGFILKNIGIISNDLEKPYKNISIFGFVEVHTPDIGIKGVDHQSQVIKGQINLFNLTLNNAGNFREKNVSIEFKEGERSLGLVTINNIEPKENKSAIFKWDTTDVAPRTYDITIEVKLKDKPLPLTSLTVPVKVDMPSAAQTLIITNKERLAYYWGPERAEQVENELIKLSYHVSVAGILIYVEEDEAVADSYQSWDQDPEGANNVAQHIKDLIDDKLIDYTGIRYIVIVGDDRIIPFYRIKDNTKKSHIGPDWEDELDYFNGSHISNRSAVGLALSHGYYFTDDFYADFKQERLPINVHVPEKPIGRLVESPAEIISLIDTFLTTYDVYPKGIFVTGCGFMSDGCMSSVHAWGDVKKPVFMVNSPNEVNYNSSEEIRDAILNKSNTVMAIFQHADYSGFTNIPGGKSVSDPCALTASEVSNSTRIEGAIVYAMSCHSGLNVPPEESNSLDLVQSFVKKGVLAYVAPTGYGMGGLVTVAGHEKLLKYFAEQLCDGREVGDALISAKRDYYLNNFYMDYLDEKVVSSTVLYGLPMYRLSKERGAEEERVQIMGMTQNGGLQSMQLEELEVYTLTIRPKLKENSSESGKPILPMATWPYVIDKNKIHGITLDSAEYDFAEDVIRVIETFALSDDTKAPTYDNKDWYPSQFFKINTVGEMQKMVVVTGQFKMKYQVSLTAYNGSERQFRELSFDIYLSPKEAEEEKPVINRVECPKKGNATIVINATDNSGILKIIVTYTDSNSSNGEWESVEAEKNIQKPNEYYCTLKDDVEFFVQAVDNNGNVAVDDNDGGYYPEKEENLPG